MSSVTLFDELSQHKPDWDDLISHGTYLGNTGAVLDELTSVAKCATLDERAMATLTLHPSRLVRGILDYVVEGFDIQNPVELLSETTKFALHVHQQPDLLQKRLLDLQTTLKQRSDVTAIYQTPVEERPDLLKWWGYNPTCTNVSAQNLANRLHGGPFLCIPLGHSSTAPAIDLVIKYFHLTRSKSAVYPVRFSRHLKDDVDPQIYAYENHYLRGWAKHLSSVVLFEETSVSGETMTGALEYVKNWVFEGMDIRILTQSNMKLG